MPRLAAAAGVIVTGGVCVGLSRTGMAPLGLLSALVGVVGLPVLAAARYADVGGTGDVLEKSAFGFGGLALACWGLWVAGMSVGLDPASVLLASTVVAAGIVAATPTRSGAATDDRQGWPTRAAWSPQGAVWCTAGLMVVLTLIPFAPHGRHFSDGIHRMGMTDWYKHLIVTTAIQESQFPPANPFLMTDDDAAYYYGFHLVAASVQRVAESIDVYPVLLGLAVGTAAAFPVVLFVFARGLGADARRAAVTAVGGALLAGFDLVVWVLHAIRDTLAGWPLESGVAGLRTMVPSTHLDFWIHHNDRQFNGPYISGIWAPHHVAAVLVALLVIHSMRPHAWRGASAGARLLPVLLLAALPALSAYVAVALLVGVAATIVEESWRRRCAPWHSDALAGWAAVGVPAAVLASPVLWLLVGGSGQELTLAVSSAGGWLNGAVFSGVFGEGSVAHLLDTPMLYLVEFGVIGVLGVATIYRRLKRGTLSPAQRQAVIIGAAIVVMVTCVRPPIDGPNNLFARPMLIVWSVLACFAAEAWCERRSGGWRGPAIAVCAGGTLLAVVGATAEGALFGAAPRESVEAARWINANTPAGAVVAVQRQGGALGYWLRRRVIAVDRRHALLFGATGQQYDDTVGRLAAAVGVVDPVEASVRLGRLGADVVVSGSPPPRWARPPCFDIGYEGARLVVITRSESGCVPLGLLGPAR